jgi:hypothetical protein
MYTFFSFKVKSFPSFSFPLFLDNFRQIVDKFANSSRRREQYLPFIVIISFFFPFLPFFFFEVIEVRQSDFVHFFQRNVFKGCTRTLITHTHTYEKGTCHSERTKPRGSSQKMQINVTPRSDSMCVFYAFTVCLACSNFGTRSIFTFESPRKILPQRANESWRPEKYFSQRGN